MLWTNHNNTQIVTPQNEYLEIAYSIINFPIKLIENYIKNSPPSPDKRWCFLYREMHTLIPLKYSLK